MPLDVLHEAIGVEPLDSADDRRVEPPPTLLEQATGSRLEPETKALLCQNAEHEFAGVRTGRASVTILARILGCGFHGAPWITHLGRLES